MLKGKLGSAQPSHSTESETRSLTDEWLTTEEAAAYLKISAGALRNRCRRRRM